MNPTNNLKFPCKICGNPCFRKNGRCKSCYDKARIGVKRPKEFGEKVRKALTGKPLTEIRKQHISESRTTKVSEQAVKQLKDLSEYGYVNSPEAIMFHIPEFKSGRVIKRICKENDIHFETKWLHKDMQKWKPEVLKQFLDDAKILSQPELDKKYGIYKGRGRSLAKKFGIDVKLGQQGGKRSQTYLETAIEKFVREYLTGQKCQFIPEYPYGGFFFDFQIGKTLIETNGDYWHGNPLFFKELNQIQKGKVIQDARKRAYVEQKNEFKLIVFWENEIINNPEIIKEKLMKTIKEENYGK